MKTASEKRSIVKTHGADEENGKEAWRALHERYEPTTIQTETAMITKVSATAKKEIRDAKEVPPVISELEGKVRTFFRSGGSGPVPPVSVKGSLHDDCAVSQHSSLSWMDLCAKALDMSTT